MNFTLAEGQHGQREPLWHVLSLERLHNGHTDVEVATSQLLLPRVPTPLAARSRHSSRCQGYFLGSSKSLKLYKHYDGFTRCWRNAISAKCFEPPGLAQLPRVATLGRLETSSDFVDLPTLDFLILTWFGKSFGKLTSLTTSWTCPESGRSPNVALTTSGTCPESGRSPNVSPTTSGTCPDSGRSPNVFLTSSGTCPESGRPPNLFVAGRLPGRAQP